MRLIRATLIDTVHLLALAVVISLLFILVVAREEPAWTDFALQSLAVVVASMALARLIGWTRSS